MKTMKKILACMLLVAMLASMLSMGTFATNVTINGATEGAVYNYYKVLDVELTEDNAGYLYKINSGSIYFDTVKIYFDLAQIGTSDVYYATAKTSFSAAAFAQAIAMVAGKTANYTATGTAESALTVDLANGYYVITSTGGSNTMAIAVPNKANDYEINEKNGLPHINKYVDETANVGTETTAEACIGDTLYYKVVITAEAGAQNYTLTDTLPDGLTPCDAAGIRVMHGETDITSKVTVSVTGQVIEVDFTDYCAKNTLSANDKLTVTYSATLNDKAAISPNGAGAGAPNTNTARLTYGTGNLYKEASASVFTGYISFNKVDGKGDPLAGASFVLTRASGESTEYAVLSGSNPTYTLTGWTSDSTKATPIVTGTNEITINGLGEGSYSLVETAAPTGYIKAADTVVGVTAVKSGNDISNMTPGKVTITNTTGIDLPETGGIGTTIFYIVGAVLLVGAVVILVTRRRMASEK